MLLITHSLHAHITSLQKQNLTQVRLSQLQSNGEHTRSTTLLS